MSHVEAHTRDARLICNAARYMSIKDEILSEGCSAGARSSIRRTRSGPGTSGTSIACGIWPFPGCHLECRPAFGEMEWQPGTERPATRKERDFVSP